MKYKITYKSGREEIVEKTKLPKFSPNFNRMVKELRIGQKMYEITEMIDIERVK